MKNTIGNTPMIEIKYRYQGKERSIFAKLESYNITGSIKDRIVSYMLKRAKLSKILKEGMPLVEATSGNTGISLSAIGAKENHPVVIFMPNWVSRERVNLMESYGAAVTLISKEDGGFQKCIELASQYALEHNGFCLNQFQSMENVEAHYQTTGLEIVNQLRNRRFGGFVSGIGTGGTLMGCGRRIKETRPQTRIVAIEPATLPILSEGVTKGSHKIEGIGDEFIPSIVNQQEIDQVFKIDDNDAIQMARLLASNLGLGVGISSGANFLGSVLLGAQYDIDVVTVFPDDNKKYLSTDLLKENEHNPFFISEEIELISYSEVL